MGDAVLFGAIGAAVLGIAAVGNLVYARVRSYRRAGKSQAGLSMQSSRPAGTEVAFSRYQPMFRLLSGEDREFVRKHQRCRKVAERWEQSQRRVIRLYLKELAADFQDLHRQARALAAHSPEQYHYLLPLLFKQQVLFWRALIWIDLRLSLGGGFSRINPEALRSAFEALHTEIAQAAVPQHSQTV